MASGSGLGLGFELGARVGLPPVGADDAVLELRQREDVAARLVGDGVEVREPGARGGGRAEHEVGVVDL